MARPKSPRQAAIAKKKRILLRDSLPGAWKEVDAEEVDLTGDGDDAVGDMLCAGSVKRLGLRKARKAWRMSAIGVVDLTEV